MFINICGTYYINFIHVIMRVSVNKDTVSNFIMIEKCQHTYLATLLGISHFSRAPGNCHQNLDVCLLR